MNIVQIAGMTAGNLVKELIPGIRKGDPMQNAGGRVSGDNVDISTTAKLKFNEEDGATGHARDFEDRFRTALIQFSNYLLHDFGMIGNASDMQGLMALSELAKKAGIEMPDLLNVEGREQLLDSFKTEWGLGEDATVEEIFNKMKEVFGGTDAFKDSVPSVDETQPAPVADNPERPMPDNFRHALAAFTQRLFGNNGISTSPGAKEYNRVLTALADKLGLPVSENGPDYEGIMKALGVNEDSLVPEVYAKLSSAFYA